MSWGGWSGGVLASVVVHVVAAAGLAVALQPRPVEQQETQQNSANHRKSGALKARYVGHMRPICKGL